MRMLLAPVVAAIAVVSVRAAEPFPAGYTLNNGRRIAFKQALPRQRNAETGLNCDWYNTKNLAVPGVTTGTDRSLSAFLHLLRNVISNERACMFADGRMLMVNKNWIRDHVHVLKGFRHWEYDYQSFVDFIIDHQRDDGLVFELLKPGDDGHWQFTSRNSVKFLPDDNLYLARLEIEADVEYLLVEGAMYCYRISGDDAWLSRVLPRLEKAIDFQTRDPMYWDAEHGLVRRGYTIDTWDFTFVKDSGWYRSITPETPMAIMHGDNSGVYQAMNQLAWFNERLGRREKAEDWRARASRIRDNMYKYLWNGSFFMHQLPLNVPPRDDQERNRLSLSAAYDMNRGLMSGDDCRKTIDAFRARQKTSGCFAEWFTVDPPYAEPFGRHVYGDYVNGAVCLFTAGELAKAALENGREEYGWDIIKRVKALAERDGALYFLYDRKTAKSINPEMGPSSWGAASVLSAFDESLAGICDDGVRYDEMRFAPRWPVTGVDEIFYATGYEASKTLVTVQYVLRDEGMRYRLKSPARRLSVHMLLPKGRMAKSVLVNGVEQPFNVTKVAHSGYVDFVRAGEPVCDIEILFGEGKSASLNGGGVR